ncbi:MAG: DUF2085 domain-containing protein [Balneolaceae bacterium]|nr:MAG: DUF2085 domain-containing protein [Balneolaceae bacterium]
MVRLKHFRFYFGVLISLVVMLFLSLGGGPWGAERSIGHWTGALFQNVCHQNPERSLLFSGVPMAVNSRCFGVFSGLLAGWLLIPALTRLTSKKPWELWLLLLAVIVQIIDYTGNLFQLWENTNMSRTVLGLFLGMAASMAVFRLFKPINKKITDHG